MSFPLIGRIGHFRPLSANNQPFCIRHDRVKSFKEKDIQTWVKAVLAASATVVSDGRWDFKA